MPEPMPERYLTARQVGERLAISPDTVLRWTRRGELPAIKLPGGAIRYDEAEFVAWLASRATAAPGRGVRTTPADAAAGTVQSLPRTTPLPPAARDEEDDHAC